MNHRATIQLSYDGSALANHEIDVKDLAPALLAIGGLLEDTNKIVNGDKSKVAVNVQTTREGSVVIDLSIVQSLLDSAKTLFSSDGADAVTNAAAILGMLGIGSSSGLGLIGFIKWLKNRGIKNVTRIETGDFKIETSDGDVRVISGYEVKLFGALNIRKHLEAIISKPLSKHGIDEVKFITADEKTSVTKAEAEYFTAPNIDQELIDETDITTNIQIVGVSFLDGNKWRFSDGQSIFYAEIFDVDFLEKIRSHEIAFAKDDILKVVLLRKQYLTSDGIKTESAIKKVLEHRSAAIQIQLPFNKTSGS